MTEQIEEVPAELIQTRVYELRPNETMRRVLDEACDYRRYCWNQGLALWNEMYKARQALKSSLASDSKKRVQNGEAACESKNYLKTKAKLQAYYRKASNIQNDLMHKFTTELVNDYDKIVIENLSVKGMLMSYIASKGVHRSMFGKFKQILTYKCDWYGKDLILANKLYPSTQRCAACGNVKKGDDKITLYGNKKHGTKHNEYICYNKKCPNYNKVVDRDKNAMLSLLALTEHPELNHAL